MGKRIATMNLDDFNNEIAGNDVQWRIIKNRHRVSTDQSPYFIYRTIDRGDGVPIVEYLHNDGSVDTVAGMDGFFRNMREVGVAFTRHYHLIKDGGDARIPHHAAYLERFKPTAIGADYGE